MDSVVKVGAALIAVMQVGVKHLQHLSHSTDAFAFIANQHEIMATAAKEAAIAAEQAAGQARYAARMSEAEAVARFSVVLDGSVDCRKCSRLAYPWETFCKACNHDLGSEQGTGTYDAS